MKPPSRTVDRLMMLLGIAVSGSAHACATCFGASDAAMAKGMNAGILSLLGFIGLVLVGIASVSILLAVRSARSAAFGDPTTSSTPVEPAGTLPR